MLLQSKLSLHGGSSRRCGVAAPRGSCSQSPAALLSTGDGFRRRPMSRRAAPKANAGVRQHAGSSIHAAVLSRSLRLRPLRERPVGRGASLHVVQPGRCRTAHIPAPQAPSRATPLCRDAPEVKERQASERNDRRQMTNETKRPGSFRNPGLCGYRVSGARLKATHLPGPDLDWHHRNPTARRVATCAPPQRAHPPPRRAGGVW